MLMPSAYQPGNSLASGTQVLPPSVDFRNHADGAMRLRSPPTAQMRVSLTNCTRIREYSSLEVDAFMKFWFLQQQVVRIIRRQPHWCSCELEDQKGVVATHVEAKPAIEATHSCWFATTRRRAGGVEACGTVRTITYQVFPSVVQKMRAPGSEEDEPSATAQQWLGSVGEQSMPFM